MDKAKGAIGEQIRKIKKIPLASQDQEDCATMEVRYKKSLAVHLRHEPKNSLITLDHMIQICMLTPMQSKAFAWDDPSLVAMNAFVLSLVS